MPSSIPTRFPTQPLKLPSASLLTCFDVSNGKWYVDLFKKILATGNVKPIPVFMQPNGIAGMKDGLQYMQDGKVSAQKLLSIPETPTV